MIEPRAPIRCHEPAKLPVADSGKPVSSGSLPRGRRRAKPSKRTFELGNSKLAVLGKNELALTLLTADLSIATYDPRVGFAKMQQSWVTGRFLLRQGSFYGIMVRSAT